MTGSPSEAPKPRRVLLVDGEMPAAALQERLVALATRNGWLESRLEEREGAIKLLEDSRPRRSWWRRLFG